MTDPNKPSTPEEQTETDRFRKMYAKAMPPVAPVPVTIVKDSDDTGKYLAAVLGSLVIGIGGLALVLWIRPEYDPLLVAGVIFAFLTPTTTSLLSFMKANEIKEQSKETQKQVVETHLSVNSRLDAVIQHAEAAAKAQGIQEGGDIANARTDALAKKKNIEK